MIKIRTAAISLMAAFFICTASHAQTDARVQQPQGVLTGLQIDSTLTEEADGSVTVHYFQHEVPVSPPGPGLPPDMPDEVRRMADAGGGPEPPRAYPSRSSGPKDATAYVGAIPLTSSLSPTGGRIHSIAVPTASDCPFPPSVALVYNSQAGNGEAGYGWSVGGLSSITVRYRQGVYDGYNRHTFYDDANAVYSLDGVPLLSKMYYGMSGYALQTIGGMVFVKPHDDSSGRALYFEALFPDGRRAVYGYTTSTTPSVVYPMTRVEDVNGNAITFTYGDDGGIPVIASINYGPGQNCHISFTYDFTNAGWPSQAFTAGKSATRTRLLKSIESGSPEGEVCTYRLYHEEAFGVNRMTSITCGRGTSFINQLDFAYAHDDGDTDYFVWADPWTGYGSFSGTKVYGRGKMLADDYDDGLVVYPEGQTYGVTATHGLFGNIHEYGSVYPSTQSLLIYPNGGSSSTTIYAEQGFLQLNPVDIDGDGRDEVVKANLNGVSGNYTRLNFRVYSFTGAGQYTDTYKTLSIYGVVTEGNYTSPAQLFIYYGDFTSAGKVQALVINKQGSAMKIFDVQSGTDVYSGTAFDPSGGLVYAMDMDGDGVTELLRITSSGWEVWGYSPTAYAFTTLSSGTNVNSSMMSRAMDFGDINGDGYMDLVLFNSQHTKLEYYLFTGRAFYPQSHDASFVTSSSSQHQLIDLNYDGYPELVMVDGNYVKAYVNDRGLFSSSNYYSTYVGSGGRIIPVNLYASRFGSTFMTENSSGTLTRLRLNFDRSVERAVNVCSDSYGVSRGDIYQNIASSSSYLLFRNASDYSSVTGYCRQTIPLTVVVLSSINAPQGKGISLSEQYKYYDAVVNRLGLGFCGFGKIWHYETASDGAYYSETEYAPTNYGVATASRSSLSHDFSNPFSTSQSTYTLSSADNPVRLPLPLTVTSNDLLSGLTVSESYTYDYFDNPLTITRTSTAGGTSFVETTTNTYDNSLSTTSYITGRISGQTVSRNTSGAPSTSAWTERAAYTYPAGKTAPSSVKRYVGTSVAYNLVSETAYTYDSYGNMTSEQTAPYGASTFTGSSYSYDTSGRHLASTTDALGLTTTYSNYNIQGSPGTVTDPLGNQTTYTFDPWGNVTAIAYPDGATETQARAWGGDGLYTVTVSGNAQPTSVTHYNYSSWDIRSDLGRFDGTTQHVKRDYTQRGRLYRESLPYKTGSPSQWTLFSYDLYGRETSRTEPTGKTTTWSYSGMTTTRTSEGIWSEQTLGPDGNLASVTDSLGTITYSYRPDGQPSSVTAPGNVVTSFTYDSYGRRTSIIDPSAGTRSTSYTNNSNGSSTVTQTNANGSVTTYIDRYGRVTREERSSSFNTDYTYNSYNQLTSVVSNNGTSKAYTYDSKGRLSTATESVPDSKSLQKSYAYDGSTGRPLSTAYTSQDGLIGTESYTYANGYHTKTILNGTATVWELTSENVLGQPTGATTLSMTRTYSYSTAGLPTGRTAGSVYGESYTFDGARGNLSDRTRTDQSSGQESFGYDDVNRLITMGTRDVTYDAKGNVTAIDGVGSMSYTDSSHPYRVTGAVLDNGLSTPGTQTVTYTAFDRPASITEGNVSAAFTYNEVSDRVKMAVTNGSNALLTRYYIGGNYEYDIDGNNDVVQRLYLEGDAYSAPVVYIKEGSGSWTLYNIARDYQGSIMAIATSGGTAVATYSYDPWGRLRNPANNAIYTPGNEPTLLLGRGYTGHEHLPWFGLINMNARLYDPLVGRFLSADPYVQAPDFTQAFNRYSYALNNPLKYTDEHGEIVLSTIATIGLSALIGGVSNWLLNGAQFDVDGFTLFSVGTIAGVFGSAISIATTAGVGFVAGLISGATGGFSSGLMTGSFNSWISGSNLSSGISDGLRTGLYSSVISGLYGGIGSGLSASHKGGNFWSGAGATYDTPDFSPGMDKAERVEYSNKSARNFSDKYFSKKPKGVRRLYADGSIPQGYSREGSLVKNREGDFVGGSTVDLGLFKGSDVYLYPSSFSSPEYLYLVMGHEYGHALFNSFGFLGDENQHFAISQWMFQQASLFDCLSDPIKRLANQYATNSFPSLYQMLYTRMLFNTYPLRYSL